MRAAPKPVKAVTLGHLRIEVPHFLVEGRDERRGGFLVGFDAVTGDRLWTLEVYTIAYDERFEMDVQDIFIRHLEERDEKLWVRDEIGREYLVDPVTRVVTQIREAERNESD